MLKEIQSETGAYLYDAAGEDAGGTGGATVLPQLSFPPGKRGAYVFELTNSSIVSMAVADLLDGCGQQGNIWSLDCEWEPSLGGATPNPVSTVQLSLPSGTAYCFQLQRGGKRVSKSEFPNALQMLLEDATIAKVRIHFGDELPRGKSGQVNVLACLDTSSKLSFSSTHPSAGGRQC